MLAQPRLNNLLGSHSNSPCIALRRPNYSPATDSIPASRLMLPEETRTQTRGSPVPLGRCKLTGTPGYVTTSRNSPSPTKIHPSKPHHVRGGSISSDLSEISNIDQLIPLQPCDSEMLVPLLHRHLEMKELIESNPAHFCRLRNSIGTRTFVKCLDLWTETTRAEKNDFEWLRETQRLIRGHDNWVLWCEVVGWDHHGLPLEGIKKEDTPELSESISVSTEANPSTMHSRKASGSSLLSPEQTIEESEMEE